MNIEYLENRLINYITLMRLNQPIGIYLLLWPTLWALWMASYGQPTKKEVLIFAIGVIITRSMGCIINDIADRELDIHVLRTSNRPLATRHVSLIEALIIVFILGLIACFLVASQNWFTIKLSILGMILIITYPFMKRFHYFPQIYLGITFSWGILMAYAAITNSIPYTAWLLFATNLVWTTIYDTQYAMVDRDDDVKIGIKSIAVLLKNYDKLFIGYLQIILSGLLFTVGVCTTRGWIYYCSVFITICLLIYQQYLIRDRVQSYCFRAFLINNILGLVIFCGIIIDYLP